MKAITVSGLSLQFNGDQITAGDNLAQAKQAIELINLELQRQPYGLGAQILWEPVALVVTEETKED